MWIRVFLLNILIKLLLFLQYQWQRLSVVVRAIATDFVVMAWQRFIYLY